MSTLRALDLMTPDAFMSQIVSCRIDAEKGTDFDEFSFEPGRRFLEMVAPYLH